MEQCMMEMEIETKNYLTELGEINGTQIVAILNDQSTLYVVTKKDPFNIEVLINIIPKMPLISAFIFNNRYLLNIFQGIMPDSGTVRVLTTRNPQFLTLQKLNPIVQLDTSTTKAHKIQFRKGPALS